MKKIFDKQAKQTTAAKKKHTLSEFEKIQIELAAKSRLFTTTLGMVNYQTYGNN
ncbi:hypothetical protein [Enterococcus hermanniensis]|uniref:Uncharacterized protein n=1 Tax=Enterococcus hermanniensis TaxID=249189 RepID=A0A1L8TQ26_9ENTE|nr:hypothetical protein [Enterococcus hermanniensis]OJG46333.1 hypothetical protein RV04_GL001499 [Enterococcus hermanniensis]